MVFVVSPVAAQSIAQDVIVDKSFPEGEPLEKAIDYFASKELPSIVIGNLAGGIYLYRSESGELGGPWTRSILAKSGAAYERARPLRFVGDAFANVVASIGNQIVLFKNPKNQGDDAGVSRPWPRQVINSNYGCHDLAVQDLDGDGKVDVICSGSVNLRSTQFVAFQNDHDHWQLVYSVAEVGEGIAVIHIGTNPIPHLVGSDQTGNIFWFENPRLSGGNARRPLWVRHYVGPGNVGNSFAAGRISDRRDAVVTASNEHEGPAGEADERGITWYEQPDDPRNPWIVHPLTANYRDMHEINMGTWNGGIPYFIVAEQENACDPAMPNGQAPSHPGVPCRITLYQWLNHSLRESVLAQTSTHNQAILPWHEGLLMADANHGAYGASTAIHLRFIVP